jgi:hypothetical protein
MGERGGLGETLPISEPSSLIGFIARGDTVFRRGYRLDSVHANEARPGQVEGSIPPH